MSMGTKAPSLPVTALGEVMSELIRSLVRDPGQVGVEVTGQDGDEMAIEVTVRLEDIETVIGKQGRILKALRTLLQAMSAQHDLKIKLQIRARDSQAGAGACVGR